MRHKPIKDELTKVANGLKLSSKPNGTWLHFESSTGMWSDSLQMRHLEKC